MLSSLEKSCARVVSQPQLGQKRKKLSQNQWLYQNRVSPKIQTVVVVVIIIIIIIILHYLIIHPMKWPFEEIP